MWGLITMSGFWPAAVVILLTTGSIVLIVLDILYSTGILKHKEVD